VLLWQCTTCSVYSVKSYHMKLLPPQNGHNNTYVWFYELRISWESRVILGIVTAAFYQHQISGFPWNNSPKIYPSINLRIKLELGKWPHNQRQRQSVMNTGCIVCALISNWVCSTVLRPCQYFNRFRWSLEFHTRFWVTVTRTCVFCHRQSTHDFECESSVLLICCHLHKHLGIHDNKMPDPVD